jgi:tetratricopeptide (TPR) repeat protein
MFELKPIAKASIPRALERAERYRLLNEPRQAESICLDVLAIEPDNQQALACQLLALTDQFGDVTSGLAEAKALLQRFKGAYEQAYYAGIIDERYAKHQLAKGHPGARETAYEYLLDAIEHYDKAETLAPKDNDDAILRHNSCVRIIALHHLEAPLGRDSELPLE